MEIDIYQVDAFTSQVFGGNPAAVCPLESWLPDKTLQCIADENNLSETAFFVPRKGGYELRWFTPEAEVDLCGHATLAAAHVLFKHLGYNHQTVEFDTKSGRLQVDNIGMEYAMNFPSSRPQDVQAPEKLIEALNVEPQRVMSAFDYVVILKDQEELISLTPDFSALMNLDLRGVVVSAPGTECDFVSRCFFPKLRINEDPVTGSAHCELAPYWSKELGKTFLEARQLSKRTGTIYCRTIEDRVELRGKAVDYLKGTINIGRQ